MQNSKVTEMKRRSRLLSLSQIVAAWPPGREKLNRLQLAAGLFGSLTRTGFRRIFQLSNDNAKRISSIENHNLNIHYAITTSLTRRVRRSNIYTPYTA